MKTGRIININTNLCINHPKLNSMAQNHLDTPPAVQEAVALESETVEERMTSKLQEENV